MIKNSQTAPSGFFSHDQAKRNTYPINAEKRRKSIIVNYFIIPMTKNKTKTDNTKNMIFGGVR